MRLFITGMKHSGKSSFAPMVASRLGLPCADSDELLGQLTGGRSVRDFYAQEGKEAFMAAEYAAVAAYIGQTDSFVLALGGGAADNARLMDLMASSGTIVYLRRAEDDLLERVLSKGIPPFLDKDDVPGSWKRIFIRREEIYLKAADIVVELGPYGDKAEALEKIMKALEDIIWSPTRYPRIGACAQGDQPE